MITVKAYFATPPIPKEVLAERKAKMEQDPAVIAARKADYRMTDFNSGIRKYAYLFDNKTKEARWYSKKEFDALKAAGKTIKADF